MFSSISTPLAPVPSHTLSAGGDQVLDLSTHSRGGVVQRRFHYAVPVATGHPILFLQNGRELTASPVQCAVAEIQRLPDTTTSLETIKVASGTEGSFGVEAEGLRRWQKTAFNMGFKNQHGSVDCSAYNRYIHTRAALNAGFTQPNGAADVKGYRRCVTMRCALNAGFRLSNGTPDVPAYIRYAGEKTARKAGFLGPDGVGDVRAYAARNRARRQAVAKQASPRRRAELASPPNQHVQLLGRGDISLSRIRTVAKEMVFHLCREIFASPGVSQVEPVLID
jgi:hypothetical protein